MLDALLARLARLILRRPLFVLVAVLTPLLALSASIAWIPTDMSFMGIMDRANPEVARYFRVSSELKLGGSMFLLLEGPEERLDDAVSALGPALGKLDSIDTVVAPLPDNWLEDRAPWLVDTAIFQDWLGLALRPDDAAGAKRLVEGLKALEAKNAKAPAGVRLVEVVMREDPMNLAAGGRDFLRLDAATQEALAPHGVTGSYAGLPAIAAQDQSQTLGTLAYLTPLSLFLVLLLFRLMERRASRIVVVAVPLIAAGGATLGAVGLITGNLTLMESFFGLTIFGLGIDFAILLIVRLREERAAGHAFDAALERTMVGAGSGVVAGALTTAGAFLIVAFAPDPTALHLGLSGAVGVSLCVVLMLTALPAMWVLLERRRAGAPESTTLMRLPWLPALARSAVRHPRAHIAIAVVVVAVSLLGTTRFHFETDLQRVFNRKVPALAAVERVQRMFGINSGPWLVAVAGLDEARRVTDALAASPRFSRVDSITRLVPADVVERTAALDAARADIEAQALVFEGLLPLVSDTEAVEIRGAIRLVTALARAREVGPPSAHTLPDALRRRLVTDDGRFIIAAYNGRPNMDGVQQKLDRLAAQAVHPEATSLGALLEIIMASERPWVWPVFFAILGFAAIVLLLDMGNPKHIAMALTPVVIGTAVTFGGLCWLGISFNVLTTLVVPLIIGLGVDSGIHVVHRFRELPNAPFDDSAIAVGRAIFLNTATTCVGFAVLLFTNHAGMESMALVMLIGLPTCLLASVTTVPALAKLLTPTRGS